MNLTCTVYVRLAESQRHSELALPFIGVIHLTVFSVLALRLNRKIIETKGQYNVPVKHYSYGATFYQRMLTHTSMHHYSGLYWMLHRNCPQ